ncbi:tat pathway signal sequence [Colletotrichum zoysiae]|uniref:Tat pathway signal sequence n=1 Tax=Colletotrichum zoysiae TaxID=1216348 RepID=A0AAD9M0Q4_9PEZI|nr:tat pathway signal sequence [Colletotrichum zoysiae]
MIVKDEPQDGPESISRAIPGTPNRTSLNVNLGVIGSLLHANDTVLHEQAAKVGVELARELSPLVSHLASLNTSSTARKDDGTRWLEAINDIISMAKPTQTKIGVVGATGSGKSSLVNALVVEEKLLPTSCAKACTSWVTEVSYNDSDDPLEAYRAEVEFVTEDAWLKEIDAALESVKQDMESGSSDYTRPSTEPGMALLRLTAVYPSLTPQGIASIERDALMDNTDVQEILGRRISLADVSARGLSDKMQAYMGKKTQDKQENKFNPWPLIKVVRIFTKADALSTGAVIADLPGVQDSNAARAAVASKYMKDCSGIWIVAPITRAADEQCAKDLLGDSFRNQMLLDNRYSAISFIGTKTDDLKIDEAAEELDLTSDVQADFAKIPPLTDEIPVLENDLKAVKQQKHLDAEALEECRDELEDLENAWRQVRAGQSVREATVGLGKRRRANDNTSVADLFAAASDGGRAAETGQLERVLNDRRSQAQQLRERVRTATAAAEEKEGELETKLQQKKTLQDSIKAACIKKRNFISAERIRNGFVDNIREFDEMNTPGPDDPFFNPDRPARDYDRIKAELPVFCVSSQAYQKMKGMMKSGDFSTGGFGGIDDTGLPRLQAHAQKLTEAGRQAQCRQILSKLLALLTSISCWMAGHDLERAGLDANTVREHLRNETEKLKTNWAVSRESLSRDISACLQSHIYSKADEVAASAAENAARLVDVWFAPQKTGGFSHARFRAICQRKGYLAPKDERPIDLHEDLATPMRQSVSRDWARVFQGHLACIISRFTSEVLRCQNEFHGAIMNKYKSNGNMAMALDVLDSSTRASGGKGAVLSLGVNQTINDSKDEASDAMFPPIEKSMEKVYSKCLGIKGAGSREKMKKLVANHIRSMQKTVFRESVGEMHERLRDMDRKIARTLAADVDKMHDDLCRDYSNALLSGDQSAKLSPLEVDLKRRLTPILNSVEARFPKQGGEE